MDRRTFLGASAATLWTGLAGCTGYDTTGDGSDSGGMEAGDGSTVIMAGNDFSPRSLSVETGTTVTWENDGAAPHTVAAATLTADGVDWEFESDRIEPGGSMSYTFESSGAHEYVCTIHGESTMCGVVVVGDASHTASLPCEGETGGGGY